MTETQAGTRELRFGPRIGVGGFGEVYRATMVGEGGLEQLVAVKCLRTDADPGMQSLQRLRDEGRILASLDHPVVLRAHDFVKLDKGVGLVTEYIDGEDLHGCIRSDSGVPQKAMVEIVLHVARALSTAFDAVDPKSGDALNLIHRDIKPSNIRIGRHGQVKLLDFGMARADTIEREAMTRSHVILGSLPYLAPEVSLGDRPTVHSDLYSLCCTLFEGLTRRRLFSNVKSSLVWRTLASPELFGKIVDQWMEDVPETIPDDVTIALRKGLAFHEADRGHYEEMIAALEDAVARLDGPGLSSWASSRTWSEPTLEDGVLSGTSLKSIGSAEPIARPEAGSSVLRGVLVALIVILFLVVATVAITSASGVAFLLGRGTAAVESVDTPVAPQPPEPAPLAPVPAEPDPVPEAKPEPKPEPKPTPKPKPRPTPTPTTKPAAPSSGPLEVYLTQGKKRFPPGNLPPGNYEIMADFGSGAIVAGKATIVEGQDIKLVCRASAQTCEVK